MRGIESSKVKDNFLNFLITYISLEGLSRLVPEGRPLFGLLGQNQSELAFGMAG